MAITENKKKDIAPFAMAISLTFCFMRRCHSFRYFKTFQCNIVLICRMTLKYLKANSKFVKVNKK